MSNETIGGFNTRLQQVDAQFSWINEMIKARQDLVLRYMHLLSISLSRSSNRKDVCYPSYDDVIRFCNALIDYVSHGHFDLYPKIIGLLEKASGRSLSIAQKAMPKIEHTTGFLMQFNDKYCEDLDEKKMSTLQKDLGELGKCLELRFKNEDRLIIGLRLVHGRKP